MPQEKTKHSDRPGLLGCHSQGTPPFAEQSDYALEMETSATTF